MAKKLILRNWLSIPFVGPQGLISCNNFAKIYICILDLSIDEKQGTTFETYYEIFLEKYC